MTYGLKVYNSSGFVQIDDAYSNHALVMEGTAMTGTTIHTPFVIADCLLFVRLPVGATTPGSYTYAIVDLNDGRFNHVSVGANFVYEYRLYASNGALPGINSHSLQVFKADGSVAFDGSRSYARLAAVVQHDPTTSGPITIPSIGINPWILTNPFGATRWEKVGSSWMDEYSLTARLNPDFSLYISQVVTASFNVGIPNTRKFGGNRHIILAR